MTSILHQAHTFRFLHLLFAYPGDAFLPELRQSAETLSEQAGEPLRLVRSFELERQELLQAEYTRLFINGYPETPCPPYESVYREKRMHGDSAMDVQSAYRRWDLSVDVGLIDHLSTEFEFLAFLATVEALGEPPAPEAAESKTRFLEEHLCRWLPAFTRDLKQAARIDAYMKLADWLESLLPEFCKKG